MAQPEPADGTVARLCGGGHHRLGHRRVLQVERQLEAGAAPGVEVGQLRDVVGQIGPGDLADRPAAEAAAAHDAVVVEHGSPVGGEPHVALDPGGPEPQGQLERLDRVLGCLGARSAVGERYRWPSERWKPGRHRFMLAIGPKWVVRPTIMRSRPVAPVPIPYAVARGEGVDGNHPGQLRRVR